MEKFAYYNSPITIEIGRAAQELIDQDVPIIEAVSTAVDEWIIKKRQEYDPLFKLYEAYSQRFWPGYSPRISKFKYEAVRMMVKRLGQEIPTIPQELPVIPQVLLGGAKKAMINQVLHYLKPGMSLENPVSFVNPATLNDFAAPEMEITAKAGEYDDLLDQPGYGIAIQKAKGGKVAIWIRNNCRFSQTNGIVANLFHASYSGSDNENLRSFRQGVKSNIAEQ